MLHYVVYITERFGNYEVLSPMLFGAEEGADIHQIANDYLKNEHRGEADEDTVGYNWYTYDCCECAAQVSRVVQITAEEAVCLGRYI